MINPNLKDLIFAWCSPAYIGRRATTFIYNVGMIAIEKISETNIFLFW
jgi:hypothetical protein